MEAITLKEVNNNILDLSKKLSIIKQELEDLRDLDISVRPEYLKTLDKIETGKFYTAEDFEKEMQK